MRFDIFDAMKYIKSKFGNEGEICLRYNEDKLEIRISVFFKDKFYHSAFPVTSIENDDNIIYFNHQFRFAIKEIQHMISIEKGSL